LNTITPIVCG